MCVWGGGGSPPERPTSSSACCILGTDAVLTRSDITMFTLSFSQAGPASWDPNRVYLWNGTQWVCILGSAKPGKDLAKIEG